MYNESGCLPALSLHKSEENLEIILFSFYCRGNTETMLHKISKMAILTIQYISPYGRPACHFHFLLE